MKFSFVLFSFLFNQLYLHAQKFSIISRETADFSYNDFFLPLGHKVLFLGYNPNHHDYPLYSTTGTVLSTHNLNVTLHDTVRIFLDKSGTDKLLFRGAKMNSGESYSLFVTDGKRNNTIELSDIYFSKTLGNGSYTFFLNSRYELCMTDGTVDGTKILSTNSLISEFNSSDLGLKMLLTGKPIMIGNGDKFGQELWYYDSSNGRLRVLHDINPGTEGSYPDIRSAPFQGKILFTAIPNSSINKRSLYITDGTPDGLNLLLTNCSILLPKLMFELNNELIFFEIDNNLINIYRSDGTENGTIKILSQYVNSYPDINAAVFNGNLYFSGSSYDEGIELWKYEPVSNHFSFIKDIQTGPKNSNPRNFQVLNNKLYFIANDSAHGEELWVSDGTANGTKLVYDIAPGASSSSPNQFQIHDKFLGFHALDTGGYRHFWILDSQRDTAYNFSEINGRKAEFRESPLVLRDKAILMVGRDSISGLFTLWECSWDKKSMTRLISNCSEYSGQRITTAVWLNDKYIFNEANDAWRWQGIWSYDAMGNCDALAIEDNYKVKPNPVRDMLYVFFEHELERNAQVYIYNQAGKLINENTPFRFVEYGWYINCSNFPPGVYSIKIINGNSSASSKFIKL